MAVLEFEFKGIDQNFRSSASNVLNDIDKIKKAFGSIGSGGLGIAKPLDDVTASIKRNESEIKMMIKSAESDNRQAIANRLADTRQAGIEELNSIRATEAQKQQAYKTTGELYKKSALEQKAVGVDLDNQRKQSLLNIAKLNEEQKRYNATQREAREAAKSIVYPIDSVVGMRNRLNELRAIHDKLSESQRNGTRVQSNLVTEINRLNTAVSKAEQATGRYQRNVGNYQQAQSGANGVAMEFNRIIQDAPYGMMGIGNNIQQLAANWQNYTEQAKAVATANGTTVTSMGLMKGAFSALLSPANLLTLGIAAATSAWTFYTMQSQKANKATKEAKDKLDQYVESLSSLDSALLKGEQNSEKELVRLNLLKKVYNDSNSSLTQRKNAYNEVISMYEGYFGKLSDEEKKVGSLEGYYKKLTNAIIQTAKARALEDEMADNNKKLRALEKKVKKEKEIYNAPLDRQNELDLLINLRLKEKDPKKQKELMNQINQLQDSWDDSFFGTKKDKDIAESNKALADWKKTSEQIYNIKQDNKSLEEEINNSIKEGAIISTNFGEATKNTTKNLKDQRDYLLEIQQILQNSQTRVDTEGEIINWDKELIKVHDYYDSQNLALDKMLVNSQRAYAKDSAKRQQIEQAINSTRITLHNNMINELSKIDDKYFSEGMAKVAELNAKYSDSMDLDTRSNALKKVRDEFAKLREEFKNDPIISQEMLDKWQQNQTLKVNWEFDNKDLEEWGKLNDKIQETIDKPFSGQNPKSIQAELEKRIGILKKLLEQLARATGQPFDQAEFDKMSKEMKDNASNQKDDKKLEKDIQDYTNILKTGVDNVFTNLKSNIDEFGLKARSVFYTLGETLGDLIKQLANKNTAKFMEQLTDGAKDFKGLADNFSNMWKNNKGQVIGAGLGIVGSGVSQLTNKTDVAGQAVGGALSGAGSMAATGNPYLIAAGAVVGGLTSALNAAKTKKQERIALKQLEEQKKANALLERMSALTYASQIIGQKTEYGIVSGVRRNEFGQIVSVVQGQDIIMVADRTNKQKGR